MEHCDRRGSFASAVAIAIAGVAWTSSAAAQGAGLDPGFLPEPWGTQPSERAPVVVNDGVSRGLVAGGVILLGTSYAAVAVTAGSSDIEADRWLAVPVIGPWAALIARDRCGLGRAQGYCDGVSFDQVGLIASGSLQAVGAVLILSGALRQERRGKARAGLVVAPTAGRAGYGLNARGTF